MSVKLPCKILRRKILIWRDFRRDAARVQDTFMTYEVYTDNITIQLVTEACKMLGKARSLLSVQYLLKVHWLLLMYICLCLSKDLEQSVVLGQFGEYFFEYLDMIICCAPLEEICLILWRIWTRCMAIALFPTRSSEPDSSILINNLRRILRMRRPCFIIYLLIQNE